MASVLWNDVVPISVEDAKQAQLVLLDDEGFSATSWQEGSMALLQVELSAEQQSKTADIAVLFKSAFLPSSPDCIGDSLTKTSSGFYDNQRNDPTNAVLAVTLACNATSGPYTINLGDVIISSPNGSTYRNVDGNSIVYPLTFATNSSVTLFFEAEVAGSAANIANAISPDQVRLVIVTTISGVTITANTVEQSGIDAEPDARLLERDQTKWSSLASVELIDDRVKYWTLKAAPAITTVAVDATNPRGQATFDVYIAELDSAASGADVALVQAELDLRTFGRNNTPKTCQVYAAPIVPLDIAGIVYFTGSDVATVQKAVEDAMLAFIRSTPCGGWSFLPGAQNIVAKEDIASVMREAARSVASSKATVALTNPTTDVPIPMFGKVISGNWSGIVYQLTNS
jgi:hypothetical protein